MLRAIVRAVEYAMIIGIELKARGMPVYIVKSLDKNTSIRQPTTPVFHRQVSGAYPIELLT